MNRSNLTSIAFFLHLHEEMRISAHTHRIQWPDNSEVHTARNVLHATLLEPRVWGIASRFWGNLWNLAYDYFKFLTPGNQVTEGMRLGDLWSVSAFFVAEVILAFGIWTVWQWTVLPTFRTNILFAICRNDVYRIKAPYQIAILFRLIIIFKLNTAAFKTYCAIWVRRSNFRHQASPRVSPGESTQRRKVELWARNVQEFCLNAELHVTFRDLLHAVKLRHGDRRLYFPSEGRCAKVFFALKIRRLRASVNPRTWVPKASTLPLDHRSRFYFDLGRTDLNNWPGKNYLTPSHGYAFDPAGGGITVSRTISNKAHFLRGA